MKRVALSVLAACVVVPGVLARSGAGYIVTILVANDAAYKPTVLVDPLLQNAWGVSLRPPGAGGHIWVSNFASGTTTTYVGDTHGIPLHQDSLTSVTISRGAGMRSDGRSTAEIPQPTGQVYNSSTTDFVVSGEGISNASKFLFVTAEGTISGWTEVPDPNHPGQLLRQTRTVVMVDQSQEYDDDRHRFTGCAITDFASGNRLYVANWIMDRVEMYDGRFKRVDVPAGRFRIPNQRVDYHPWNIQFLHTGPGGQGRLWVTYAQADDPWEQIADSGEVAEFDLEGNFIRKLHQAFEKDPLANGELRGPWGLAIAPADFGPLSGSLLVANFGDGTIAAYDLATAQFSDFVRDKGGNVIVIDGLWGITFGNGVSLGDSNALYFSAGPNSEKDGLFGSIRVAPSP